MAKEYFEKLNSLVHQLRIGEEVDSQLEVKHFFTGAALYSNEKICASWSPVGIAFKLPDDEAATLIASGEAIPLRYFDGGHVKNGYALFENPGDRDSSHWKQLLIRAASVQGE